jgi:flavin reductase (DIM6/NTAB) family NADH-FMN oxidoreductase RutF
MRSIPLAEVDARTRYRLVNGIIVPRPIAWVATRNHDGLVNLAPFSFFNGVEEHPAMLMFSVSYREPEKDTLRNLREVPEAVVHLVHPDQVEAMIATSRDYPPHVSEADELGLRMIPSQSVSVPRLDNGHIAIECRLNQLVPLGPKLSVLAIMDMLVVHIEERYLDAAGLVDPETIEISGRLTAGWYVCQRGRSVERINTRK